MDAIMDQLRAEASKADEAGRIKLLKSLRDLQLSIETPADSLARFSGLVSACPFNHLIQRPRRQILTRHSISKSPQLA